MGTRKGPTPVVSRLRVVLCTLLADRECLTDALEFNSRGIETVRKVIEEQTAAEAPPAPLTEAQVRKREEVAEILSITGQWRRNRRTWGWIAKELNRRGYRRPRGGLWSTADIQPFCMRRNKVFGKNGHAKKETGHADKAI